MSDDVIHFTVPQSLKGRWVAHCRAQKPSIKLVPWLISVVEGSLGKPLQNPKSTERFGKPGEPTTPVILRCEAGTRTRWENLSRAESLRMTDWFVNRIEQFKN